MRYVEHGCKFLNRSGFWGIYQNSWYLGLSHANNIDGAGHSWISGLYPGVYRYIHYMKRGVSGNVPVPQSTIPPHSRTMDPLAAPPPTPTTTCSSTTATAHPFPTWPPAGTPDQWGKVCRSCRRQKIKKALGPDSVSSFCLRACTELLAPTFTQIFNQSLELCKVPSCFKSSTIAAVAKTNSITGLNTYRPVALTSVVMKSFEGLVLRQVKDGCSLPGQVCGWRS